METKSKGFKLFLDFTRRHTNTNLHILEPDCADAACTTQRKCGFREIEKMVYQSMCCVGCTMHGG